MKSSDWTNTTVVGRDLADAVRRLKGGDGPNIVILGSGSLVAQLAGSGLIDGFRAVICPVVLGTGRTQFDGLDQALQLSLVESRAFANGKTFARYRPA